MEVPSEGVLLAVRTLGYTYPGLVRANDLTGFSHFTLDGSWLLDGSRTLESDTIENRWAVVLHSNCDGCG